jgi:hypothetical protein
MSEESAFTDLLQAGVGDGIAIGGRCHAIAQVGRSSSRGGFGTREYTLGDDEDYYLIIEGVLGSGDPDRCRAVVTHEVAPGEVGFRDPLGNGKPRPVTEVLKHSDFAPPEVVYHGRRYRFSRRTVADYASDARQGPRVTWDFESAGRNLAVERWPADDNEMAVYEGRVLKPSSFRVVKGFRPRPAPADGTLIGMACGVIMVLVGLACLLF